MTDFATGFFKCPVCGNDEFVCYPQTVVIGQTKHDWEYTCIRCKTATILKTKDWRS